METWESEEFCLKITQSLHLSRARFLGMYLPPRETENLLVSIMKSVKSDNFVVCTHRSIARDSQLASMIGAKLLPNVHYEPVLVSSVFCPERNVRNVFRLVVFVLAGCVFWSFRERV